MMLFYASKIKMFECHLAVLHALSVYSDRRLHFFILCIYIFLMSSVLIQKHSIKKQKKKGPLSPRWKSLWKNTSSDLCALIAEELFPMECGFLCTCWEQNTGAEGKKRGIHWVLTQGGGSRNQGDQLPQNGTSSKTWYMLKGILIINHWAPRGQHPFQKDQSPITWLWKQSPTACP